MTDQERTLFAKLADHRREASKIFNHKDFKGGWMSVCDKYSESAHFIYELLQNADDVQALIAAD